MTFAEKLEASLPPLWMDRELGKRLRSLGAAEMKLRNAESAWRAFLGGSLAEIEAARTERDSCLTAVLLRWGVLDEEGS